MPTPWLLDRLRNQPDSPVILHGSRIFTRLDLLSQLDSWNKRLAIDNISAGDAILFDAGYDAEAIALFFALLVRGCIAVPLSSGAVVDINTAHSISGAAGSYRRTQSSGWTFSRLNGKPHTLFDECRQAGQGGLVIFTSGSTGEPKASLHRADRFLSKFERQHQPFGTLLVLPFDHMAGLDSFFYALTSGGSIVIPEGSDADSICMAIEQHRADLFPATPSLLNLIWLSGAFGRHDVSSLKLITYGAEVMPEITLQRLGEALPKCKFLQKYGATEFGAPSTRSRADGSLWFKISDQACEAKIVDGTLWVRTPSAMMGYLNAASPIAPDGWINTGDRVEVDGDFIRVLGRQSEMINVGGQKVNPSQVESVLLSADNIEDAVVWGEKNPILGNTVTAAVCLRGPEDSAHVIHRLRIFCRDRLPREAVPVRIEIADDQTWNSRYKKVRHKKAI